MGVWEGEVSGREAQCSRLRLGVARVLGKKTVSSWFIFQSVVAAVISLTKCRKTTKESLGQWPILSMKGWAIEMLGRQC